MSDKIYHKYLDLSSMDTLSQGKSILHQMNPVILSLTTLLYLITVVSFDRYTIAHLVPFFLYPIFLQRMAELPFSYFLRKIILVSPFILFFVFFNLFLPGGLLSSLSIILRFILTVSAGLILMAIIGINGICLSLEKLHLPKVFVTQILLLYRYLYVLTDELSKMMLAKTLRQVDSKRLKFKTYVSILGHLFLRSLDRAERIYLAMCSRGFNGQLYYSRKLRINKSEVLFLFAWSFLFILFRLINIPLLLGNTFTR